MLTALVVGHNRTIERYLQWEKWIGSHLLSRGDLDWQEMVGLLHQLDTNELLRDICSGKNGLVVTFCLVGTQIGKW